MAQKSSSYPYTWSHFDGLKPIKDGKIPKFWVQDLTEDRFEYVIDVVCKNFVKETVLSKATKLYENAEAVKTTQCKWRAILSSHLSIAALTTSPEGEIVLAGCNILTRVNGKDKLWKDLQAMEGPIRDIYELVSYVDGQVDLEDKYGTGDHLGALGLWVDPAYRGQGVGTELLKARVPLCRAHGLPLTVTLFTGGAAQKCALKAGFEIIYEELYSQYKNSKGERIFAHADGRSFMYMAMRIK